ncbi:MAG: FAD-binding oxidoreductase [Burkholderiales bacterium]|nr:FAD-binding oxidoreductase [Burkholderiales bacterium]
MTTPINPSLYAARIAPSKAYAALDSDARADVVIIGGGLTGISTALHAASQGLSVIVLEAARVGYGASGRNGGQALQGYAASMAVVERALGMTAAQEMWAMSREALALLKENIARFGIDCQPSAGGYLYAALHRGQLDELAEWREHAAKHYGYTELGLLDADAVQAHVATQRYVGGLLDAHEIHLNPLSYILGLAQAAEAQGAIIHEQTPVTGWRKDAADLLVTTANGNVRCRHLVLATNAGIGSLEPRLAQYFLPVESFIVATAPLGAARAQALIPSGVAVADCNRVLNYFRVTADQRLLFGGRASGTGVDRAADTQARMLSVFPQLADVAIEHAWGGIVDVTPNKLPHFGRLADQVYFAQGFSGHGLALTGLAGRVIAEAIAGAPRRFDLFAKLPHTPIPTRSSAMAQALLRCGLAWFQVQDWLDAAWYID